MRLSFGIEHSELQYQGIEIVKLGHTSGCVPTFVVDAPRRKDSVMPQYVISQNKNKVILRNFEGVITTYTEPEYIEEPCTCDVCTGRKTFRRSGALEETQ